MLEYFGFYDTPSPIHDDEVEERVPDAPVVGPSSRRRHTAPLEPTGRAWEASGSWRR